MKNRQKADLLLSDGRTLEAISVGAPKSVAGQLVFCTAMNAYPETLTDPSYRGQILVFTYPLIGNYGFPAFAQDERGLQKHLESNKIQVAGIITQDYTGNIQPSEKGYQSLSSLLLEQDIPCLSGVDTRSLTQWIRTEGDASAIIKAGDENLDFAQNYDQINFVAESSIQSLITYGTGKTKIALLDCGLKESILKRLLAFDTTVIRLPYNYSLANIEYDALVVSNGPGHPKHCQQTVEQIRSSIEQKKPYLGICLGHQLLGMALGLEIKKLDYGHRGHNQPVKDLQSGRCYMTAQNHAYWVCDQELPANWTTWFRHLMDGSCEGLRHQYLPQFSVQFHPEAKGGPEDSSFIFELFINAIYA